MNYGDAIRKSVERPYSRGQQLNQSLNYDNHSQIYDLPDPNQVKNNTRDTLTVRDVLHPHKIQNQNIVGGRTNDNSMFDSTPSRAAAGSGFGTFNRGIQAKKFASPSTVGGINSTAMSSSGVPMNNGYLQSRSEVFQDNQFETVEKRCFFLLCGKLNTDPAIAIELGINAFDDARQKKNLQCNIALDQLIIEYNNEILKALTSTVLGFKILFNFSDLHPAPGPSKLNKKRTLQRMIELQAPLYVLKKQLLRQTLGGDHDENIRKFHAKFLQEKEEAKPEAVKKKEMKDKQVETAQKMRKLDKQLAELNLDVAIQLRKIYFGLAADKDEYVTSGQTLLEVGIDNQSITIVKEDKKCKATVFGASITTLNSFELLFMFANKLKKVSTIYLDNMAIQTSLKHYKELLKNIGETNNTNNKVIKEEEKFDPSSKNGGGSIVGKPQQARQI